VFYVLCEYDGEAWSFIPHCSTVNYSSNTIVLEVNMYLEEPMNVSRLLASRGLFGIVGNMDILQGVEVEKTSR